MGWFGKKKDAPDANELLRQYNAQEEEQLAAAGITPSRGRASASHPVTGGAGVAEFSVEDVFTITGRGQVATGKTTTGTLRVGDDVVVLRGSVRAGASTIAGIETFGKRASEATAGVMAGLLLKPGVELARGDILRRAGTA